MKMLEMAARALAPKAWAAMDTGDSLAQTNRRIASLRHVPAVLRAIREPDERMLEAMVGEMQARLGACGQEFYAVYARHLVTCILAGRHRRNDGGTQMTDMTETIARLRELRRGHDQADSVVGFLRINEYRNALVDAAPALLDAAERAEQLEQAVITQSDLREELANELVNYMDHELMTDRNSMTPLERRNQEAGGEEMDRAAINEQINTIRLKKLQNLCGYVQNGTADHFTVSLDDATREYCIRQGKQCWFGRNLHEAIDQLPEGPHI